MASEPSKYQQYCVASERCANCYNEKIDVLVLAAFAAHELPMPQGTFWTGKNLHEVNHVNDEGIRMSPIRK
jgi:hypothetical protein